MDKQVYVKTKEFKLFGFIKLSSFIEKYEECVVYDIEPSNPIIEQETDINDNRFRE